MENNKKFDLLDLIKQGMKSAIFKGNTKEEIIRSIESSIDKEAIRVYCVSDFELNNESNIIRWGKRESPLSDDELKELYGK